MNINELFDTIDEAFGRRRLLQHSPVSPDVWQEFLEGKAASLDTRYDLLLTVSAGSEAFRIAHWLRKCLNLQTSKKEKAAVAPFSEVAANANTVVARLTLADLICVVVPMTRWWRGLSKEIRKVDNVRYLYLEGQEVRGSEEVEFLSFAATAGLIRLHLLGEPSEALDKRRSRTESTEAIPLDSQRRYGSLRHINSDIIAMLRSFDKLWDSQPFFSDAPPNTEIERVFVNRRTRLAVATSRQTIQADAVENLVTAPTSKLTWAIVDCGIDARHVGFATTASPVPGEDFASRVIETYDFTRLRSILSNRDSPTLSPSERERVRDSLDQGLAIDWSTLQGALRVPHDRTYSAPTLDHGTHVAGILGANAAEAQGICPEIQMMDIRVFDDAGTTDEFTLLSALQFLGFLNRSSVTPRIHGVNLSLSLVHKVRSFACGRTPICDACDRLVKDGIVVVAAAGNAGYDGDSWSPTLRDRYQTVSITDPGNAEAVITVGSTHKVSPFGYGVSYFSSRGPTGDGRMKPDILAPGEKILSCLPGNRFGEMDGTSMAAPHVSGAAAILLARYSELIGRPELVKQILCTSARDLGRERSFQGHGLVDVLSALQVQWKRSM